MLLETKSFDPKSFDRLLAKTLDRHLGDPRHSCPENLGQAIRYTLLLSGKRIRPRLSLASGHMMGLSPAITETIAVAMEMIHCFTLIHDDLPCMDDDDMRRGKPSNHKIHGEAVALLAGNALMALGMEVFSEVAPELPNAAFQAGFARFIEAVGPRGVLGGQAREFQLGMDSTLEQLRLTHQKKTGALFEAAILIPKDLAGLPSQDPKVQFLSQFAVILGEAFQISDDLEDAIEDAGKGTPSQHKKSSNPVPQRSILYYESRERISQATSEKLNQALQTLKQHWGTPSDELGFIGREVLERLTRFSQKPQ